MSAARDIGQGEFRLKDPLIGHWMMLYIKGINPKHDNLAGFRMMAASNSVIRGVLQLSLVATLHAEDRKLLLDVLQDDEDQVRAAVAAMPYYGRFASPDSLREALLQELPLRIRRKLAA